ncbi:MAG TPA: hypothetical protein VHK67_06410 [Rhabdochlamydiaceae bacterium]|nr:hypothetical protein [Rhabdochlamydiaceae bacterium]
MKKLLTLGLLATAFVLADEGSEIVSLMKKAPEMEKEAAPVEASYGYVSLGVGPLPELMPIFGIGGRYQRGHHGFDGSIQFGTLGRSFTVAKENLNYLYYFNPNLNSQFYVGGGIAFTEMWSCGHMDVLLSPQAVVGKQYTNKNGGVRYLQVQIDPVFLSLKRAFKDGHLRGSAVPAVVLSYGLCF